MAKHYTELTGAQGERIKFSAPLFEAESLFNRAAPEVRLGTEVCPLLQIGALEFSVRCNGIFPDDTDKKEFDAEFLQHDESLLVMRVSVEYNLEDGTLRCRAVDRAIDVDALVHVNAAAVAAQKAAASNIILPIRRSADVPPEYKVLCADTLDTLGTLRQQIAADIEPFEKDLTEDERLLIDREVEESVSGEWLDFITRGNRLVLPYKHDDAMRARMKRYTENVLTPELCKGAFQHRCFHKPMGYPGDYMIMNALYDHKPTGDCTYTRLLDLLGRIAGRPVPCRMRRITDEIEAMTARHPDQEHFHVMSVGAGPAREWSRYFERNTERPLGFTITLVDPEVKALEYAIDGIYSSIRTGISSVLVSGMNASFTEMLRPTSTFRHLPKQDLIYCAGLTDYLNEKLTRSLAKKLYQYVKPGGKVVIGNINDAEDGMYWPTEYTVDWSMYFRNQQDMEKIADGLPGDPELTEDSSGSYHLLTLTRPH